MAGGHRLPKGAKTKGTGKRAGRGAHRAAPRHPEPYAWLGAGAVTLGLGAALASGSGVAYADDGTSPSTTGHSTASTGATDGQASTGTPPKKKKKKPVTAPVTDPTAGSAGPTDGATTGTPGTTENTGTGTDPGIDPGTKTPEVTPDTSTPDAGTTHHRGGTKTGTKKQNSDQSTKTGASAPAKDTDTTTANDDGTASAEAKPSTGSKVTATANATTFSAAALTTAGTAGALTTAATPAATPAVPKAIAAPVLQFVSSFLHLFGLNTNTPLPPLDLGLAAAWTWFRDLQTEWGYAPPTGGTPTATEPDPGDGTVTGNLNANNPLGLPLTYTVTIKPILGTVTVDAKTGNYTYTPSLAARIGAVIVPVNDLFTVTVSNGIAANYAIYSVKVGAASSAVPGIPTKISQRVNTATGEVTGQVGSSTPVGASMTYSVLTPPVFGSLKLNSDGTFSYKPSALAMALAGLGLQTSDVFSVVATNGSLTGLPGLITVPITAGNATPSNPVASNQVLNAATGVVTGTLTSTDPAGQPVTYSVIGGLLGTLTISGNTYTYKPSDAARLTANLGVITTDTFLVTASNGTYTSGATLVTVPISPASANTPSKPVASGQTQDLVSGVVTGTLTSTSPDGQPVTYSVLGPVFGTLTISGNTYTYKPSNIARSTADLGVTTTDSFTVVANNGTTSSAATTVSLPISGAGHDTPGKPSSINQVQNKTTGVVTGTLTTSSNPGNQALTYNVVLGPLLLTGSVSISGNTYTYTPTALAMGASLFPGLVKSDTFTVTVTNGDFTSSVATITVPILAKSLL